MNPVRLNIAIAGAGIAGLSVATMLARHGARVTIYDQMEAPRPVGSGFVIQPTGAAVLDSMGLLRQAEARGQRIDRMLGRLSHSDRIVLDIGYSREKFGIAIQRVALFEILLDAAIKAGVSFETCSKVNGVESGERPILLLESGRAAAAADLVIDAMGANSPLGLRAEGTELEYGALWATVPWPTSGPFHSNLLEQRYVRASRMAGVLPVGTASEGAPQMATFFWSLRNRDFSAWQSTPREKWVEEVANIWPDAATFAQQAEPVHARYRHHTQSPFIGRNAVRIGDACHAASPQLGQGANMALLDAASLAYALQSEPDVEDALQQHANQRNMHIRLYQALSHVMTPFYQSDSQVLPLIRDLFIGPVSIVPGIRRIITTIVTGELTNPTHGLGLESGQR